MKYVKQTSNLGGALADVLNTALRQHQRVIWLVPGGSNVPISIEASRLIDAKLSSRLVIMQTDERYVSPTDPDCNWYQLQTAGFEVKNAKCLPIIVNDLDTCDEVTSRYNDTIQEQFALADHIVGQFGVGPDAHIAGIKPDSPASTSSDLVASFTGDDFERVTMTFSAIKQLSVAVVFMFGKSKWPVLERLQSDDTPPLAGFPVGILKELPKVTIFNDKP